jgi:hypothetical protein
VLPKTLSLPNCQSALTTRQVDSSPRWVSTTPFVRCGEGLVHEQELCFAVTDDVLGFGGRQSPVDRRADGAELAGGERQEDAGDVMLRQASNPVLARHAGLASALAIRLVSLSTSV